MGELNIHQRINAIQKEVEYIKRGQIDKGTGVLYDEVIAKSRALFVEHGVLIVPDLIADNHRATEKNKAYIYEGFYRVSYINIDNPEDRFYTDVRGDAIDTGDKGPGKSLTYAVKASMVKVLLLETGINDESRSAEPQLYSKDQFTIYHDLINDQKAFELYCFSQTVSEEMTTSLYNSFPDGKKTSGKKEYSALMTKGLTDFQNLIDTVDQMADKEDIAITEELDDLGDLEKRVVAGRLQPSTIKYLKSLKDK